MIPLALFKRQLTTAQKRTFDRLDSPSRVQAFIEELPYIDSDRYRCPLSVLGGAGACCYEGALMAAAAFWYHGKPPLLLDLFGENDDDHILALYRVREFWGACAKSNFTSLRSREPVYRTLRELVLSYFPGYYNRRACHTLRGYTVPLDLRRCKMVPWLTVDAATDTVSDRIDRLRKIRIVTPAMARHLQRVDERTYNAGILGGNETATFTFYQSNRKKAIG